MNLNELLAVEGYLRTQLCIKGTCARVGEVFVVIFMHTSELSWACLGWGLHISLHPFSLGHPSLLMPNILSNKTIWVCIPGFKLLILFY